MVAPKLLWIVVERVFYFSKVFTMFSSDQVPNGLTECP